MDDFNALQQNIQAALVATTRSASALANEDLPFHRSLDPSFGTRLDTQNARLLALAERLLGSASAHTETVGGRSAPPVRLSDIDAVDGNWRVVVDVVDSLLERADTALDEFTGAVKRLTPTREGTPTAKPAKPSRIASALRNQDIEKPQLQFEHDPSNQESGPFKPLLLSKPHASVPLETVPAQLDNESQTEYPHPYQLEIEQYQYPAAVYTHADPIMYHPFESTTAELVDTEDAVEDMLRELKQAKEIAIDLEHHDQRSYIGIVSLMQISTRDRDWIVDTLKPWRRKLQCLNEVFADPSIVKVLHGAYMDVVWLQRDLGLYLVGLFDTHYAARALGYSGGSLAFLLKKFADVDAQKQYQTADWRIRPLPQELFDYARSDTHYLLYIYDCMRNELISRSNLALPNHEGDKLWDVLQRSSDTALQRYEHPVYDVEFGQGPVGWFKLLSRTPASFTKVQFAVFRAVHKWRDDVAREQDDSVHYVMANHHIFSVAKSPPRNKAELLSIAQPTTQTLRLRADELIGVIKKAEAEGSDGPEMLEVFAKIDPRHWGKQQTSQAGLTGVAQYLPKPVAPITTATTRMSGSSSTLPLRTPTSSFWGAAFDSSVWQQPQQKRQLSNDIPLAVPLPPLAAEAFADTTLAATPVTRQARPSTPASASNPRNPDEAENGANEDDEIFILKQMGKKRKRQSLVGGEPDGVASQSDSLALVDPEEEAFKQAKAERRKAKKEAKRAAREGNTALATGIDSGVADDEVGGQGQTVGEEEYFDYDAAPDMLHPPRLSREEMKKREKARKQVNPYAKAMDAPKGLPRAQRERAGKSATFKS